MLGTLIEFVFSSLLLYLLAIALGAALLNAGGLYGKIMGDD